MARDGSGNYSLPAGNPVVTGTTVSSTTHNSTMTDIASALTASIAKDGQTTPSANLPMGGYKHTAVANGTARDQYAAIGQIQDGTTSWVGSVSGTDTITGSLTPAISSYVAGMKIGFIPANTNTGNVTIALNGLTAKQVFMPDGNALLQGDLRPGVPVTMIYDGTYFRVTSLNQLYGNFMLTATGFTGTVTTTAGYARTGRMVTLIIFAFSGTSNASTFTFTGIPAGLRPVSDQWVWGGIGTNGGATTTQRTDAVVGSAGTITLALGGDTNGWTASGTKGLNNCAITYLI